MWEFLKLKMADAAILKIVKLPYLNEKHPQTQTSRMLTRTNISVRLSPTRYFPSETRTIGYWFGHVHLLRIWRTCQHRYTSALCSVRTNNATHRWTDGRTHSDHTAAAAAACRMRRWVSMTKSLPGGSFTGDAVTHHKRARNNFSSSSQCTPSVDDQFVYWL